jgi:hypothetical protein
VRVHPEYNPHLELLQGYEWLPAQDPESDPCRHWWPGSRPFEAHEVNALASYLTYRTGGQGHVVAFLDLRSYGQMRKDTPKF